MLRVGGGVSLCLLQRVWLGRDRPMLGKVQMETPHYKQSTRRCEERVCQQFHHNKVVTISIIRHCIVSTFTSTLPRP